MTGSPSTDSSSVERPPDDRLDSWKEIAAYMRRDVTTVQRWEKREGMPVRRHLHDKMGSVYAFKADLDAWARARTQVLTADAEPELDGSASASLGLPRAPGPFGWRAGLAAASAITILVALAVWQWQRPETVPEDPLIDARFVPLTDFDGIEQAAAISPDGRFVAFLSDRDGPMDVWVTSVGVGQFYNLTRGSVRELVNPSVRTLGFSPDGTLVTFWARQPDAANQPAIGVWAVPVLGGQPRPYLDAAAELAWTSAGDRLVYHTPGPGDPMFVRESSQVSEARQIFTAPAGLHSHFPIWAPDQGFIYFVQGTLPDRLDIWRLKPSGGSPERITSHESFISNPVFVDARTLLYLASDADGPEPVIHSLDVERRTPRRGRFGVDRYTSLSASADGRRLVATVANSKGSLWRVPIERTLVDMSAARRIPLTTSNGSSPRSGAGYLLYVASKGTGDSIWKLQDDKSTEVWSAPNARIIGGPAIARDGRRIAFSVRQDGQTLLYAANADGTDVRIVGRSLDLEGAPAWMPDGQAITVAVKVDRTPRLFTVPLNGREPTPLVGAHSVDPVWSPDGELVAFSGADIGTTFEVKTAKVDGSASDFPPRTLTRGGRHMTFMPGRRALVVLRGAIRHKNLWLIDLETGAEHQLTDLPPEFEVRDFDVSPDGREVVLERVQEQSDLVLIERPGR
jgi:Tol biopolymer transport system component